MSYADRSFLFSSLLLPPRRFRGIAVVLISMHGHRCYSLVKGLLPQVFPTIAKHTAGRNPHSRHTGRQDRRYEGVITASSPHDPPTTNPPAEGVIGPVARSERGKTPATALRRRRDHRPIVRRHLPGHSLLRGKRRGWSTRVLAGQWRRCSWRWRGDEICNWHVPRWIRRE